MPWSSRTGDILWWSYQEFLCIRITEVGHVQHNQSHKKWGKSNLGGFENYFSIVRHICQKDPLWVINFRIASNARYWDLKTKAQLNISKHRKSFPVLFFLLENHSPEPPGLVSLTFINLIKIPQMESRFPNTESQNCDGNTWWNTNAFNQRNWFLGG